MAADLPLPKRVYAHGWWTNDGQKISKSKGNGIAVEEWLTYAPPESLSLFMFQQPKRAKRLYFDVIPKNTDEYVTFRTKLNNEESEKKVENPSWHIHNGDAPKDKVPLSFGLLLNLASVCHAEETSVIWGYIARYANDASPRTHPFLDTLANLAVNYYRDFVRPSKTYRQPSDLERQALEQLASKFSELPSDSLSEDIQTVIYSIGKEYQFQNLRDWFQALYQVLLGQDQGPRFGSFVALYGLDESIQLIKCALAGEDLLFQIPLAGVTGNYASAPSVNIGSMINQGLDFQIINRGSLGEGIAYEVTLNSSFLKNEITALADNVEYFDGGSYRGIAPIRNAVGQSLSTFFGYNVVGYFNSQAEADAANQDGAGVGRFKYEDVNNDGKITPDDRTYIGSPVPDWTGGMNLNLQYKNFSLNTYFYASVGAEIFNQSKWFTDFFGTFEGSAKGINALQSWTPGLGDNAVAPIWELSLIHI